MFRFQHTQRLFPHGFFADHSGVNKSRPDCIYAQIIFSIIPRRSFRQTDHAVFRGNISCRAAKTNLTQNRRNIDETSFPGFQHFRNLIFHSVEHSRKINRNHFVPTSGRQVSYFVAFTANSGVIYRDMQTTEFFHRFFYQSLMILYVCRICFYKKCFAAVFFNQFHNFVSVFFINVAQGYLRTFFREKQSGCFTNSRSGTCNNCDFIL